ncbi:MAG: putative sugar nucleotidyl transferase [Longimicrobiales bacterium]
MSIRLYLVDDVVAQSWRPFTLTRPAGEMLFGTKTLRARSESFFGANCAAHITAPHLDSFEEIDCPPTAPLDLAPNPEARLFVWSRFVPSDASCPTLPSSDPAILQANGAFVGLWLPPGATGPSALDGTPVPGMDVVELGGSLLETVWEVMSKNGAQISLDAAGKQSTALPDGVHRLGDHSVSIGDDTQVEPGVVIDARGGPVVLGQGVHVHAFTRIAGPAFVADGAILLGGAFGEVTIGPSCRIRGEVRCSIVHSYSNKAHDGFLGHSILGQWVNLGAMTTNSNLKNNYGPVRLLMGGQGLDTGMTKVGCFLGDHVKTGIGTLLNTGTIIEAATNVFGGAMPPKYVPPFSWGAGTDLVEHDLERFLQSAEVVMSRREVELSAGTRDLLTRAFSESQSLRTFSGVG